MSGDFGTALNQLFDELDGCETKEEIEKYLNKYSTINECLLIFGIILIIVGLVGWLAMEGSLRVLFIAFGGTLGVSLLIASFSLLPTIIKSAKEKLEIINKIEYRNRLEGITLELFQDLPFVKEVSNVIFNREINDLETKILRQSYLSEEMNFHPFANAIRRRDSGMTKSIAGKEILNILRVDTDAREAAYSQWETAVDEYYALTREFFSDVTCVSFFSSLLFGGDDIYNNEIKEMLLWLEDEKGHVLSQLMVDNTDSFLSGREDVQPLFDKIREKKDVFLKIFNEWNSNLVNAEINVINNENNEQPTVEAPKTPQEEANFGGIVLN